MKYQELKEEILRLRWALENAREQGKLLEEDFQQERASKRGVQGLAVIFFAGALVLALACWMMSSHGAQAQAAPAEARQEIRSLQFERLRVK